MNTKNPTNIKTTIWAILLLFLNITPSEAEDNLGFDNVLSITDKQVEVGKEFELEINLKNETPFTAFELELNIPEGFKVVGDEDGYMINLDQSRQNQHTAIGGYLSSDLFKVVVFSIANQNFKGNDGKLLSITIEVDEDVVEDYYFIDAFNIKFSEYDKENSKVIGHVLEDTDGEIEVTDGYGYIDGRIVTIGGLNYILLDKESCLLTMYSNEQKYSGDIVIPQNIVYENRNYNVVGINSTAFYECTELKSVEIPEGVEKIYTGAFYGCTGLTSLTIPNSVNTIDGVAFMNCSNLRTIKLSNNLKNIYSQTFRECSSLEYIEIPNSVENIERYAFGDCCGLKIVTLPENIEEISDGTFFKCQNLEKIEIPLNVKSIGCNAFQDCTNLKTIVIPDNVTTIRTAAFWGCTALETVSLPNSLTRIENQVFYKCESLKSIEMPDNLRSLGKGNFMDCTSLETVVMSNGIKKIGSQTFARCSNLKYITFSNQLSEIELNAFYECVSLESVVLPNTLKILGEQAFANCTNLQTVFLPNSLEQIYENPFAGCNNLSEINVVEGGLYRVENGCLISNDGKIVTGIDSSNISIPTSAKIIGVNAFYNYNKIEYLYIPSSIEEIEKWAFQDCISLVTITCEALTPPTLGEEVWDGVPVSQTTLLVPSTSVELYCVAEGWSSFTNIRPIIENVLVEEIDFNYYAYSLSPGESLQLVAAVLPENATDKTLIWSTSDENVAMVSETGLVTAVAPGEATITATCGNVSATCEVIVNPILVESIELNYNYCELEEGEAIWLEATVLPENATNKEIEWTSSDEDVVMVNESGYVTFVSFGDAVVTATAKDRSRVYATCVFTNIDGIEYIYIDGNIDIYTLDGKKVQNASKGVYIVNGKKVMK